MESNSFFEDFRRYLAVICIEPGCFTSSLFSLVEAFANSKWITPVYQASRTILIDEAPRHLKLIVYFIDPLNPAASLGQ